MQDPCIVNLVQYDLCRTHNYKDIEIKNVAFRAGDYGYIFLMMVYRWYAIQISPAPEAATL